MKAPKRRGGGRPASRSLVHSTDLGRAPEEMVVVRGQEGMQEWHLWDATFEARIELEEVR